jgi:ribosomal protein S18 acetylase RimI-like enzyme
MPKTILHNHKSTKNWPQPLYLRAPCANDAQLFYDLVNETLFEYIVATWGRWNEELTRQNAQAFTANPHARVICLNDIDVGIIACHINSTEIFVQDIYLFAAHQQNGWARCVINALQNDARRLNLPIRLGVLKVNPAIGFYTRQGFALERADAQYFYLIWRA